MIYFYLMQYIFKKPFKKLRQIIVAPEELLKIVLSSLKQKAPFFLTSKALVAWLLRSFAMEFKWHGYMSTQAL